MYLHIHDYIFRYFYSIQVSHTETNLYFAFVMQIVQTFEPFVNSHKKVLILQDFKVSFIDPIVKFGIELNQMKQVLAYLWYYHKFMVVLL